VPAAITEQYRPRHPACRQASDRRPRSRRMVRRSHNHSTPNTCRPHRQRRRSYSTCPVAFGLPYNAVLAGLPALTLAPLERVLQAATRIVPDMKPRRRLAPAVQLRRCTSRIQMTFAGSQLATGTQAGVHLGVGDTSRRYTCTIYTACLVVWQPRHTADMSTNQRQSFLCCRTTCMEHAVNGPEAAAVDRHISS